MCVDCTGGSFGTTENGTSVCADCPPGTYQPFEGTSSCVVAPYGSYVNTTASTGFAWCRIGFFSDVRGATSCQACQNGSFTESIGATACMPATTTTPPTTTVHIPTSTASTSRYATSGAAISTTATSIITTHSLAVTAGTTQAPISWSCSSIGCVYNESSNCQCDAACRSIYNDCCADYNSVCIEGSMVHRHVPCPRDYVRYVNASSTECVPCSPTTASVDQNTVVVFAVDSHGNANCSRIVYSLTNASSPVLERGAQTLPYVVDIFNGTATVPLQVASHPFGNSSIRCAAGTSAVYFIADMRVSCLPCQQHTFSSARNATTVSLHSGVFSSSLTAREKVACQACTPGSFTPTNGWSTCISCNSTLFYTPADIQAICNNTNTCGTMMGISRDYQCLPCAPSTVALTSATLSGIVRQEIIASRAIASSAMVLCDDCADRDVGCLASTGVNQSVCSDCVICPRGYHQKSPSVCEACRPGTYSIAPGSTNCTRCPVGMNAHSPASIACTPDCFETYKRNSRGTFDCVEWSGLTVSMTVRTVANRRRSIPSDSPTRDYALLGNCMYPAVAIADAPTCGTCPYGMVYAYNSSALSATCVPCPAGSYDDRVDESAPYTVFSEFPYDACTTCAVGTFQSAAGSTSCYACPAETFANSTGQSACSPCGTGFTTLGIEGSSACIANCSSGTRRINGTCVPCSLGTAGVVLTNGTSACVDCLAGYYTDTSGYASPNNSGMCLMCPAGTFQPFVGRTGCYMTPPGSYSMAASSWATECPVNAYSNIYGAAVCTPCANGTGTADIGAVSCTPMATSSVRPSTQALQSSTVVSSSSTPTPSTTTATTTTTTTTVITPSSSTTAALHDAFDITPPPPPPPPPPSSSSMSTNNIIAIVCVVVFGSLIIIALIIPMVLLRDRRGAYGLVQGAY